MASDELEFRRATEADLDRVVEIHVVAFPDGRNTPERRRNFASSRFGRLEDLWLAERHGDIVGHAFLFPLQGWFGGRPVPMGGIASVAVAPEVRGQGVATAFLHHLHVTSDVRGDALTMLYAFRQRFYARLGYGPSSSRKRLVIDPASIPASWRALARARVRRARGDDASAIAGAYARAAARASGWLTRSEALWERRLVRERRQFLVAERPRSEGKPCLEGYVSFEVVQDEPHAATSLRVEEVAADDDVTRLALLGALAAMRDQVRTIELEIAEGDRLELALVDSDGNRYGTHDVEHALGTVVGGPMVRIEDVPRAFEARGYAADGTFDVVVHAGDGAANVAGDEIAVSVRVEQGRAEVSAARASAAALRTTKNVLASLLYGGLRPADAVRLGLAAADPRTLARIDTIFAMAPLAPVDPF
jgi:predicted acetyltransferase